MAKQRVNTYQIITDRIIEKLETGDIPWKKPWKAQSQWPTNLSSKKKYRGINVFLLLMAGFDSPQWATFKQIKDKGGHVRKGEKSFPIVFWKKFEKKDNDENGFFVAKYYNVFNLEQTEGIDYTLPEFDEIDFEPDDECENIIKGYIGKPGIQFKGSQACYSPDLDVVRIPEKEKFNSSNSFYATLFHELGHSTGHENRLNRPTLTDKNSFGSHAYSKEELVAEFCSSFLCAEGGIDCSELIDNSAAYIKGWVKKLKEDPKVVVQGAAQAQRAADLILNRKYETVSSDTESGPVMDQKSQKEPGLSFGVPCSRAVVS